MLTVQLIMIVVPVALMAAIALQRATGRLMFVLATLAQASGILFIWLAMPWDIVSIYWRMAVPVLLVLAISHGYRRVGTAEKTPSSWQKAMNYGIYTVLFALFTLMNLGVIAGYSAPANPLVLSSPLRGGTFVVGQGGASPFLNGHFKVNPQNHALDILGINAWGARIEPFSDRGVLENYAIFNAAVVAPCAGEILIAVDGLPDLEPGQTDVENLAGNHVVIECNGNEVVLAHLRQGSVEVIPGDSVSIGDSLGRVGNSGNTSEPHLHIHAERNGEPGVILDGEAVPITIDGRHLVRNSRF